MTLLVLTPPARQASSDGRPSDLWWYALSRDGLTVDAEGWSALEGCPRGQRVVLLLQESDVAWMEVRLPHVAANRLRPALVGALEEQLLDDPAQTHLALGPQAAPSAGSSSGGRWVAAIHKPWLVDCITALRAAGLEADALVAATEPSTLGSAHARLDASDQPELVLAGTMGVGVWPLLGASGKARAFEAASWSSEPGAAQALRDALGRQAPLLTAGQRAVRQASSGQNLLQFDLAPQLKASRALRSGWDRFMQPQWRWVRRGLLALALVQIAGLNLAAWRGERELAEWDARTVALVRQTFPSVQVVLDAPMQMEREVVALRQAAGEPGPTDLDAWLDVLARHWPPGSEPLAAVRLDRQALTLEARSWPPGAREAVMAHAARHGWSVQDEGLRLRLAPGAGGR